MGSARWLTTQLATPLCRWLQLPADHRARTAGRQCLSRSRRAKHPFQLAERLFPANSDAAGEAAVRHRGILACKSRHEIPFDVSSWGERSSLVPALFAESTNRGGIM